jgi:hypothetical protein
MAESRASNAEERLQAICASHAEATRALKQQVHALQQRLQDVERAASKVGLLFSWRRRDLFHKKRRLPECAIQGLSADRRYLVLNVHMPESRDTHTEPAAVFDRHQDTMLTCIYVTFRYWELMEHPNEA